MTALHREHRSSGTHRGRSPLVAPRRRRHAAVAAVVVVAAAAAPPGGGGGPRARARRQVAAVDDDDLESARQCVVTACMSRTEKRGGCGLGLTTPL